MESSHFHDLVRGHLYLGGLWAKLAGMDDLVGLETVQPFNCADDLVRTDELVRLSSFSTCLKNLMEIIYN